MKKKSAEKKIVTEEDQQKLDLAKAYQRFFNTEDGMMIMSDLMRRSYFLTSTLGKTDKETERNEGMTELFKYILYMCLKDPGQILDLIISTHKAEENYDELNH